MYIKIDRDKAMISRVISEKYAIWRIDETLAYLYSTYNLLLGISIHALFVAASY